MCYSPITIINPSKFVSIEYKDRFLLQVPCGQCAECQQRKSAEWLYRAYYEFVRTFEIGSDTYAMFDTLTYDNDHLPYMDELLPPLADNVPSVLPHVPCFRSSDVTKFLKLLRIRLKRKFGIEKDAFRFFLCSEYGSLHGRPHYHLLLFVNKYIDELQLSSLIAECWKYGRTDGYPYRPPYYVMQHNVIKSRRNGDIFAAVQYVTKYIEKDCKLQSIIDKRIRYADAIISSDKYPYKKRGSVACRKLRTKIAGEVNQFHFQSLGFGELALRDIDINKLYKDGCVDMPSHKVITSLPLPMYYARKMFYDLVDYLGCKSWQLNNVGISFKNARKPYLIKALAERFEALNYLANTHYDSQRLAIYVISERGRFLTGEDESTFDQRIAKPTHYVYSTQSDKENIGCGVSLDFCGNSALGYTPLTNMIKFKDFINKYVYINELYEEQLEVLYQANEKIDRSKQLRYSRVQELKSLYKELLK